MDNYSDLMAFITAMGGTASTKKPPKIAPGGLSSARPAPSKFRSQDGVSDSTFVQQIIQSAQEAQRGTQTLLTTGNQGMQPPMMQPQMAPQQPTGGGLAGILQLLGGGGR